MTMTNHQLTPVPDDRSREAYRYALITAGLMAVAAAAMLIVFGMPTSIFDATIWSALVFLVALFSAWLIKQDHIDLGLGLIILTVQIGVLLSSIETSGLAIALVAVGVTLTFSLTPLIKARRLAMLANTISVAMGIFLLYLDFFEPFERTPNPNTTFAWVIGGGLALIYIITILRRFPSYSLRNKLMVSFVGVTVIATGTLGLFVVTSTTTILQDNLERELTGIAAARSTRVGDLFNEQINILTTTSLNKILQDAIEEQNQSYEGDVVIRQAAIDALDTQWRAADAADNNADPLVQARLTNEVAQELIELQGVFPNNIEIFITDIYGSLIGTTNRTSDYYQADEGWWQAAYNNGQGAVYISEPEFDESANVIGVQIAIPILSHTSSEIVGIIRTTYLLTPLANILQEHVGETGTADLFISGEAVSHIHEGGFELAEPELFERLQAVADQGMVEMEYEGERSVVTQAPIRTLEGNEAVDNLGWIIVFHQQQDEAFAPVNTQLQGITIVMLLVIAIAAGIAFSLSLLLVRPIIQLTSVAEEISAGNLDSRAEATTSDEVGTLATAFNSMTSLLQETLQGLEERVTNATRNLTLAAEVGRNVSQAQNVDTLLTDAVNLIQDRFDMYYTQAYLLDPAGRQLVMRAGTGAVGQQLLNRRHSLPMDLASLNGTAALEKRAVVIEDTEKSIIHRPNPLLPETRSEMVVPLLVGDRLIGVLDMQSRKAGVLSLESLPAFEALAGQISVAIQNVELLEEAEAARLELEAQAQRLIHSGWRNYLNAVEHGERIGYRYDNENITPFSEELPPSLGEENLVATIHVSKEPIGVLQFEGQEIWTNEDKTLVNNIAEQLGKQVESIRLLNQADRYRAEAEDALRRVTREGWQAHFDARKTEQTAFAYDLNIVTPLLEDAMGEAGEPTSTHSLEVSGEKIGEISVAGTESSNKEVDEMLSTVGEYLSARIENLRLFEETERGQLELDKRARELATVAEVSTTAATSLDTEKLLQNVVDLTRERFDLYHAHIFLLDEKGENLQVSACGWEEGSPHAGTHEDTAISLDTELSIVAEVARTRQASIVNDVRGDPNWLPNELMPDTRSEMAVPLIVGDNLIGVFDIQSNEVDRFTEGDIDIQTTLASQIAVALQNARSFQQAQKQADRETTLNIISQKIQSATSVEAVLQIAARELGHALNAPMTIAQLSMKDKK